VKSLIIDWNLVIWSSSQNISDFWRLLQDFRDVSSFFVEECICYTIVAFTNFFEVRVKMRAIITSAARPKTATGASGKRSPRQSPRPRQAGLQSAEGAEETKKETDASAENMPAWMFGSEDFYRSRILYCARRAGKKISSQSAAFMSSSRVSVALLHG